MEENKKQEETAQLGIGAVGRSFILNNKQRPDNEGVYEVIRSDGSHDFNYFDGRHWLIDIENGKRPVREWR